MPNTLPEIAPAPMPVFLTSAALGRRLGCCPATIRRKMAAGVLVPDAAIVAGSVGEQVVFNMAKLPDIRALFRGSPILS